MRELTSLPLFSKCIFVWMLLHLMFTKNRVNASVFIVTSENVTFAYEDADSAFGGVIPSDGLYGNIVAAEPLDGCNAIFPKNSNIVLSSSDSVFVLIQRGGCVFDTKVKNAQDAGYTAAIVFNDEPGFELITMSGRDSEDISIPSVFVAYDSGQQILSLLSQSTCQCYISPTFDNTAWSVMAVSFMSLLAVSAVLATFFFVRRHRLRQLGTLLLAREEAGMTVGQVKALPVCVFETGQTLTHATSETCAICLEDYEPGEKLRILPCKHEFHVPCIDQWLTTRRPFCPVCKRDARTNTQDSSQEEQETSPLLGDEPPSDDITAQATPDFDSPNLDSTHQTSPLASANETSSGDNDVPLLVTIEASGSISEPTNLEQPLLHISNPPAEASNPPNLGNNEGNGGHSL